MQDSLMKWKYLFGSVWFTWHSEGPSCAPALLLTGCPVTMQRVQCSVQSHKEILQGSMSGGGWGRQTPRAQGIGKDRGSKVRVVSMYPHVSHNLFQVLEGLGAFRSQRARYGDSENALALRELSLFCGWFSSLPQCPLPTLPPPLV